MNAHSVSSTPTGSGLDVAGPSGLTSAIIANIPLLRLLAGRSRPESWAAFAAEVGQDKSNFLRTRRRLAEDGAIDFPEDLADIALTDLGRRALRAFAAFEGKLGELPAGVAYVKVRDIVPNPDNPRSDWTSEAAVLDDAQLKASIAASDGPNQPPVVCPPDAQGLHMINGGGERRWRACMANIADGTFPEDKEILVIIKAMDERQAYEAMGEENIQRRNFTFTEEARWYEGMIDRYGHAIETVAARGKRSVKHVQDYLRLLKHPDVLKRLETDGDYTLRQARADMAERNNPGLADKRAQRALDAANPGEDEPKLKLTAAQALVFAELADKGAREPVAHMEPGYTRIADMPGGGPCGDLIKLSLVSLRNHGAFGAGPGPFGRALLWQSGGEAWLRERGFYEGEDARQKLLIDLREAAGIKRPIFAAGKYSTNWLNVPEAEVAEKTEEPQTVDIEELTGSAPQPGPRVQPGLVGDEFSQLMRRAREEADPPSAAPEPGSGSTISPLFFNVRAGNAEAVKALSVKVETRLLEWLHGPELEAHHGRSWDDTAQHLATLLEAGEVVSAIAILTPHLRTAEGMAAALLDRSLTMMVERHGGRV